MHPSEPGDPPAGPARRRFQTTRWSLVLDTRSGDTVTAREALSALCEAYWYPLYAFVRRRGHDAESAADLVQGFFTRLLETDGLAAVDPHRGRFRSFLMAACSHYLANQRDRDRALKRGGGRLTISIDRRDAEDRYGCEPIDDLTAERLFERRWALSLLEHVLERLEAEAIRDGKARRFEVLKPALLGSGERVPYAQIGAELGLSEDAARAAAARLRRRYREILREEVARTLDATADIDVEIRALFSALGG